jgi:hypothetical protein
MERSKVRAAEIRAYIQAEFLPQAEVGFVFPSSRVLAPVLGCCWVSAARHLRIAMAGAGVELHNLSGGSCGLVVVAISVPKKGATPVKQSP